MALPTPQTSPAYTPCSSVPITPAERRSLLFRDIDVLLDVGSNLGQYAMWVRSPHVGFRGRIVSFEPAAAQYASLSGTALGDDLWRCYNLALGPDNGTANLHIARDSEATSILHPTGEHLRSFPDATKTAIERVPMRSLTSLWDELQIGAGARVYLKIDVEGFELGVLRGAEAILDRIALIELELSIAEMYVGGAPVIETLDHLNRSGFTPLAIEQNGGDDSSTGQQLMCDGIFRHVNSSDSGARRI